MEDSPSTSPSKTEVHTLASSLYTEYLDLPIKQAFSSLVANRSQALYDHYQTIPASERFIFQRLTLRTYQKAQRGALEPILNAASEHVRWRLSSLAESDPEGFNRLSHKFASTSVLARSDILDFSLCSRTGTVIEGLLENVSIDEGQDPPETVEYFYLETKCDDSLRLSPEGQCSHRLVSPCHGPKSEHNQTGRYKCA
jgi:hypothetical protein